MARRARAALMLMTEVNGRSPETDAGSSAAKADAS
jgi:hypothetical protein